MNHLLHSVPLQWHTKYSPRFKMGFRVSLVILIVTHITFLTISFLEKCGYRFIPEPAGDRSTIKGMMRLQLRIPRETAHMLMKRMMKLMRICI